MPLDNDDVQIEATVHFYEIIKKLSKFSKRKLLLWLLADMLNEEKTITAEEEGVIQWMAKICNRLTQSRFTRYNLGNDFPQEVFKRLFDSK